MRCASSTTGFTFCSTTVATCGGRVMVGIGGRFTPPLGFVSAVDVSLLFSILLTFLITCCNAGNVFIALGLLQLRAGYVRSRGNFLRHTHPKSARHDSNRRGCASVRDAVSMVFYRLIGANIERFSLSVCNLRLQHSLASSNRVGVP